VASRGGEGEPGAAVGAILGEDGSVCVEEEGDSAAVA
jgi:hypothetical protein